MKSPVSLQYFKNFVSNEQGFYHEVDDPSSSMRKSYEEYFIMFQLITMYQILQGRMNKEYQKLKKFNPQAEHPEITMEQKDLIVEIVRRLDKNLDMYFPNFSRENFYSVFQGLIVRCNCPLSQNGKSVTHMFESSNNTKMTIGSFRFSKSSKSNTQINRSMLTENKMSGSTGFDMKNGLDYIVQ